MVRFLIADDAGFIHEIIENTFSENGFYKAASAYSGQETLDAVARTLPDVIFLDFVMPVRSGLEIMSEIKTIWPGIKIIGMSTLENPNIMIAAKKNGMDEFLEKPFTKETLYQALENVGLWNSNSKTHTA